MVERPVFQPWYRVTVVGGEGVFLVCDQGQVLLPGLVYERLAPLIDGHRSTHDIATELEAVCERPVTYYALMQLEQAGHICAPDPAPRSEFDRPSRALRRLVSLAGADAIDARLVIVDNYLSSRLDQWNRSALQSERPWMMAKVVGQEVWLGPLFIPHHTACWSCLAHRLRVIRPVDAYLDSRRAMSVTLAQPNPVGEAALERMVSCLATEAEKLDAGELAIFDVARETISRQAVVRRPQCGVCGNAGLYPEQLGRFDINRRSSLTSAPTAVSAGISKVGPAHEMIHVYVAAPTLGADAENVVALRAALAHRCVGSGTTDADAKNAVVGETIERYSGTAQGDEPRIRSSLAALGERAIHPNACMLFSEAQYSARHSWNARGESTTFVPERFDEDASVDWTQVWSLTRDEPRLLPTAYLYRGAGAAYDMLVADTNGCAAGSSLRDAVVRGFLELVERDSIALWWYRRRRCTRVDLSSLRSNYCRDLEATYLQLNRECWLLDITSDLDIPTFAAVTRRHPSRDGGEQVLFGFGAHFQAELAAIHAVTEMNQAVALFDARRVGGSDLPPAFKEWAETATIVNQPYVSPTTSTNSRRFDVYPDGDACEAVDRCRHVVESRGLEFLVLDQSRPDVALAAAKVLVPGLRPAVARFAPGRLFTAIVDDEHRQGPLAEESLNPIPFFL